MSYARYAAKNHITTHSLFPPLPLELEKRKGRVKVKKFMGKRCGKRNKNKNKGKIRKKERKQVMERQSLPPIDRQIPNQLLSKSCLAYLNPILSVLMLVSSGYWPCCIPSQPLTHLHSCAHWGEQRKKILDTVQILFSNIWNITVCSRSQDSQKSGIFFHQKVHMKTDTIFSVL